MSKKYAVIGHPIGHTMSPFIHKRLFELSGIDAEYTVVDIEPENFERDYYNILKKLDGYNITIPHKQRVIPFLDKIDDKAKVLERTEDRSLATKYIELRGVEAVPLSGNVVILGCGGVARTMAYEALLKNAALKFAVREKSIGKAKALIEEIKTKLDNPDVSYCLIDELSEDITTLINATPVGMSPNTDFMPVSEAVIKRCENVYDAIYNPLDTKLIKTARKNGVNAESGMSMLVWQAVVAHYHWDKSDYDVKDIEKLCEDAAKELMSR